MKSKLKKTEKKTNAAKIKKVANGKVEMVDGIKKKYLKTKNICKVTFILPKATAENAHTVSLVGEFNNWDSSAVIMKKLKNSDFSVTLDLETGKEYQFRYLIDKSHWENDSNADHYKPSPFGSMNSVVVL